MADSSTSPGHKWPLCFVKVGPSWRYFRGWSFPSHWKESYHKRPSWGPLLGQSHWLSSFSELGCLQNLTPLIPTATQQWHVLAADVLCYLSKTPSPRGCQRCKQWNENNGAQQVALLSGGPSRVSADLQRRTNKRSGWSMLQEYVLRTHWQSQPQNVSWWHHPLHRSKFSWTKSMLWWLFRDNIDSPYLERANV